MKKLIAALTASALLLSTAAQAAGVTLLNVSYDPTRELYKAENAAFAAQWKQKTGQDVTINQSHGGSGKQARAVIDGLDADVVTLALAYDVQSISDIGHLMPSNWASKLPNNSTPYTSTIVFLVRKGNPFHIKDWSDLVKPGIQVVTPNPKTSGGARWAYLAAWSYGQKAAGGNPDGGKAFVKKLYSHVPVLDTGARGSTTTFTQRGIGDVLLSWENEAHQALAEEGGSDYQIVYPKTSILAEPPVAVVEKNAARHKTTEVATAYLQFLYTKQGQEIAAKFFYRPRDTEIAAKYASQFPNIELSTIDDFGGWDKAQKVHFADGGMFDQIYTPGQ